MKCPIFFVPCGSGWLVLSQTGDVSLHFLGEMICVLCKYVIMMWLTLRNLDLFPFPM
jgi:hypothetical protein